MYVAMNNGTFNEDICLSSSFMLGELICGQGIIIMITALSGAYVCLSVCLLGEIICGQGIIIMITALSGTHVCCLSAGGTNLWPKYHHQSGTHVYHVCMSVCLLGELICVQCIIMITALPGTHVCVSICLLGELIFGQSIIIMITALSGTHVWLSGCLSVCLSVCRGN